MQDSENSNGKNPGISVSLMFYLGLAVLVGLKIYKDNTIIYHPSMYATISGDFEPNKGSGDDKGNPLENKIEEYNLCIEDAEQYARRSIEEESVEDFVLAANLYTKANNQLLKGEVPLHSPDDLFTEILNLDVSLYLRNASAEMASKPLQIGPFNLDFEIISEKDGKRTILYSALGGDLDHDQIGFADHLEVGGSHILGGLMLYEP